MALLDGKYEILSEHPLGAHANLFEATAPDGSDVRIVWFVLHSAEDELLFERYRQALRSLRRAGLAAVHDLVARPGAHYVAWQRPPKLRPLKGHSDIEEVLGAYGYSLSDAFIAADGEQNPKVYGLAFNGTPMEALRREPPRPPLTFDLYALLPALVLSLAGLLFIILGLVNRNQQRLVILPDVQGQTVQAAAETLYRLGLRVETQAVAGAGIPGQVLYVSPPSGSQIWSGRRVTLRYVQSSSASRAALVPELRGLTEERLMLEGLEARGLQLGSISRIASNEQPGTVLAQALPAGTQLPTGSRIDLLVSAGPGAEQTLLPDLRGFSLEEATALAYLAGIINPVEEEWLMEADAPFGTVVAQNIVPNLPINREHAVLRLALSGAQIQPLAPAVSEPPPLPEAPPPPSPQETIVEPPQPQPDLSPVSFFGMTLEEAQAEAASRGVTLGEVNFTSNALLPQGVIVQTPSPDEAARRDRPVNLTVNRHSAAAATPPAAPVATPEAIPAPLTPAPLTQAPLTPIPVTPVTPEPAPQSTPPAGAVSPALPQVTPVSPGGTRTVPYRFYIEPNIPESIAVVEAITADGGITTAKVQSVRGGDVLEDIYLTTRTGPVTFNLKLNGIAYLTLTVE